MTVDSILAELSLRAIVDVFLHLDRHLNELCLDYGNWVYAILFLVIFAETGFVVTPFLPGDSLLFVAGTQAATGSLSVGWLLVLLTIAGILGDGVNYHLGKFLGPRVLRNPDSRIFKKKYLDKTHAFYEKYGGKTIIIARFVPIVRTFAPFVAGVGTMSYGKFLAYNVIGAIAWVTICLLAGYFFGNIPIIKKNFELVVLAIIAISVLPMAVEYFRARQRAKSNLS